MSDRLTAYQRFDNGDWQHVCCSSATYLKYRKGKWYWMGEEAFYCPYCGQPLENLEHVN